MQGQDIVLSESEYQSLVEEIHRLQARISELTALRDDLLYHVCPSLRAEYEEKIGSLERELLAAEMYLRENQRVLEILQAQMNQQKEPSIEEAEEKAREEFREYEEELKRKAKEAEEFRDHWQNETQWSEHDRKEKEERRRESGERENAGSGDGKESDAGGEDGGNAGASNDGKDGPGQDAGEGSGKDGAGSDQDGSGNGSGPDGDEFGEEEFGEGFGDEGAPSGKKDTPARKLKRIYRRIVKRLHPDVHPNATAREKELFNLAQQALKDGNLEMMENIWEELSGMDAPEEQFSDTPEGRAKLKELLKKLLERMRALEMEIRHIRSEYPYTMKSFLENEDAVEERRSELLDKLKNLREANEKLTEFIRQMRQQMGMQ